MISQFLINFSIWFAQILTPANSIVRKSNEVMSAPRKSALANFV